MNRKSAAAWGLVLIMFVSLFLPCAGAFAEAAVQKPLAGRTISVMGDSISTYIGWSNRSPITDPDCTNRYGEPYYGPVGSDCHNTELLVTDTWWHQAATELGAEILMSNAGNSTGLFYASYPANADWDLYLKELLAWKSRPKYLGKGGAKPDIIALYIGSNEVARGKLADMGSINDVDFDTLIQKSGSGYTYKTPTTVAEAYCILLHQISVLYPDAEVYCFAVVPSAGGTVNTCNKRLKIALPFNEMVRGVAAYFGATVVDLMEAYGLDPDGDGIAKAEDFARFQACYNNDPHPNAAGFDVISRCFVDTVLENSRYVSDSVDVETRGGSFEPVTVTTASSGTQTVRSAIDFETDNGYLVDYRSRQAGTDFAAQYSVFGENNYTADGGSERDAVRTAPQATVSIPLTVEEGKNFAATQSEASGMPIVTGDVRESDDDGVYNYSTVYTLPVGTARAQTLRFLASNPIPVGSSGRMTFVASFTEPMAERNLISKVTRVDRPESSADVPPIKEGYEFVYIGSDQISNFYSAHANINVFPEYSSEEPVYVDSGGRALYVGADHVTVFKRRKLVVPRMYIDGKVIEGEVPARYDSIQQFTLANSDADIVTTYCAEQGTSAEKGWSYRLFNLEDSHYYGKNAAEMIRTVSNNGYWGTASGWGSLSALHENMRSSGKFTEDEIARTTDGIAMTATQYGIWTFSNAYDPRVYYNAYYINKVGAAPNTPADKEDADLIFKIYNYLISLPPTARERDTRSTVINDKNFLENVSITIHERADHANNRDTDPNNDVYIADLSFELSARPSTERGDDLVMRIKGINGGSDVYVRVAGTPREGEIVVTPDGNNVCTLHDLQLKEGKREIDFFMGGTQVLSKDAHLFLSEVRDGANSQTMVGIASGPRDVAVSMLLEFDLEVDDDLTVRERIWRTEGEYIPPTGDGQHPMLLLLLIGLCGAGLCLKRKIKNRIY